MLGRIRRLMRTPLAQPEPPSRLRRFAPEVCAGACYLAAALTLSFSPAARITGEGHLDALLLLGAGMAYVLAGLLLFLVPMGLAAMVFARERDRSTLDALLMTPLDRESVVWGRFWSLVTPWLRLMLYLIPFYGIWACSEIMQEAVETIAEEKDAWPLVLIIACLPKPLVGLGVVTVWFNFPGGWGNESALSLGGAMLMALRAVNDLSIFPLVTAAAFHISARARSTGQALALSFLIIPFAMLTVLAFDVWIPVLWGIFARDITEEMATTYGVLASLAMLFRFGLAWWLVRRVARNFDAYATGERPAPRSGWARRWLEMRRRRG